MTRRSVAFLAAAALAAATPGALVPANQAHAQAALDFKQIDDTYDTKRHDPNVVKQQLAQLEQAARTQGATYDITWRIARLYWWNADAQTENSKMESLSRTGWDWAEKATKANPNGVEGHFWLAANMGQYSLAVGVLRALSTGLEGKFLGALNKSLKINPLYADAGPLRTQGSYHMNLPWPKRDLPKAIQILSDAAVKSPRGIRSRWYLAQAYEKNDNIKAAVAELDKIIAASPAAVDPSDLARLQPWARQMKARLIKGS